MARTLRIAFVTLSLFTAAQADAESAEDAVRERDDQIAELMRKVDVLTDEVATLRTRKRPSGTSGERTRASMPRNNARRIRAAASRPIVCADVQPASLPFTIA